MLACVLDFLNKYLNVKKKTALVTSGLTADNLCQNEFYFYILKY